MPAKISASCTTRRKPSLGKLRRAHPASGATWNVQVVRGKMSSKCLWHACRALILGMILMFLGAGMAIVGYYADQLSIGSETRGNFTVRVKNETKGFHLNNLSYIGPIVMGFGGFIVVASCVMTFEARDSAAKVVPARFKATTNSKINIRSNSSSTTSQRRANGMAYKNAKWDHHLGVFRSSPAEPAVLQLDRQALTAALVHFSKTLGHTTQLPVKKSRLPRSGSVPNLTEHISSQTNVTLAHLLSPNHKTSNLGQYSYRRIRHHHHRSGRYSKTRSPKLGSSLVKRTLRESENSLFPVMSYQRHNWNNLSMDETGYFEGQSTKIKDRNKRSDTAKRHILSRQKPIENEESQCTVTDDTRKSSAFNECIVKGSLEASRTASVESKNIQVDLHSPESQRFVSKFPRRLTSGPSSTPSVEREFRSQLSICSEPITVRQLSGQSSIEPCVPEENMESDDIRNFDRSEYGTEMEVKLIGILKQSRPESLRLNNDFSISIKERQRSYLQHNKILHRSNSSLTFYRPKPKITNDYDSVICTNTNERNNLFSNSYEVYDSLQVINERRKKILKAESDTTLLEKELSSNCSKVLFHTPNKVHLQDVSAQNTAYKKDTNSGQDHQ